LELLDAEIPDEYVLIEWIKRCENPDGGYGWKPDEVSDVGASYDAYVALKSLSSSLSEIGELNETKRINSAQSQNLVILSFATSA